MRTIQIEGQLFIPGINRNYYLIHPYPIKRDDWMTDDMCMFHVVIEGRFTRHIVVKGAFLIDYELAGNTINIQEEVEEEDKTVFV